MRTLITLGFIFSAIISLNAQDYVKMDTLNTAWNEREEGGEPPIGVINQYSVQGDTIINGLKYFKILNEHSGYLGCFREENKVVKYIGVDYWEFDTDSAVVLYDFNKTVGDTVITGTWQQNIIVAIDSVLIENSYRKQYSMHDGQQWIEGIGSTFGFRYPITAIPTSYWKCELACFKKDENVIYLNPKFTDCETLTSIKNKEKVSRFTVFPNPLTKGDHIMITNALVSIKNIEIFDASGKLVFSKAYKNNSEVLINSVDFETGFLILKVLTADGASTKKIIVN